MKIKLITLLVLSWTLLAKAQTTADDFIALGRSNLVAHAIWNANNNFTTALALSPTNATANALVAVTRLLVLPQTPAGSNFLNQLNVTNGSRDIYNWTASQPQDTNGNTIWPANYNSSTVVTFYRNTVMAALVASATNLANIKDTNFTLSLTVSETAIGRLPGEDVTLDYGDVQLLRALLAVGQFAGYTINAQNASVVIPQLQTMSKTGGVSLQSVLATYPSLLTLSSAADLTASKGAFTNASALYFGASDFIRNVRAPNVDRLFDLATNEVAGEAKFRTELTNALLSLNGPVQFSPSQPFSINASNYFSGAKTLRSLLPQFFGNRYVNNTLPDYTFGGVLLNEPAFITETLLRQHLGRTPAGIYGGSVSDLTYNDYYNAGFFGLFVGTNRQATIVGYDVDSFQNFYGAQSGGIGAQFPVDESGNWSFNSNSVSGVSGYGSITSDGWFSGELYFTNGDWVAIQGDKQPVWGDFQYAAGNYSGNYSVTSQGQHVSGKLQAVLSAAGELPLCIYEPGGAQNDGGMGLFGSDNKFITTNATSGNIISGTLNPATFQITGAVTNSPGGSSLSGTFKMSRSAYVPFDVPPVITVSPPDKFAALGTNITFSLVATGSPPLCYQWYFNDTAIPQATAASLTLSNVTWAAAGNYSVTVSNVVGGSNTLAVLTVVPETVKPGVSITAPANGQRWSNSVFTVTGKASDNVQVSNVWFQVNSNGWQLATPVNTWTNWTATASLLPGTNLIQAYAVDTSGNNSTNASANLVYVVSDTLRVRTVGAGTLSPNYSNNVLEIGKSFSMTATPGTGFVFTNWTISTNWLGGRVTNNPTVQFVMASNLTLQATFADVAKPTLSITNLAAGQRVSTAVFTVKGTASDNAQVATVWYQLNGGGWTNATPVNGWLNWNAALNLLPGTNAVAAFAVDTSGNASTTNAFNFQFVVTNVLGVQATGLGTLSPNYSNSWLEVGRNYSMTATPATGFVATNWTVSTNWAGGVKTNSAIVQFQMASNLTLRINFADVSKPILTVSAPAAGQKMTNALANLVGTASDNWKVTGVWYQLNNDPWNIVNTTNSYTNWTKTVTLVVGTNTLKAYALDLGGNFSTTNNWSVVSSNAFKLQLAFTNTPNTAGGWSFTLQISPGLNGRIQSSTNLLTWATLTNFVGTNTSLTVRDPASTNSSRKFYRAVVP